jgi:hypothetical protein
MLTPLRLQEVENGPNHYYLTNAVRFKALMTPTPETVSTVFDFAYNMTFGNTGEHRNHRSGGSHRRKNGELFINTFQGKIAEYGIYGYFKSKGIELAPPDMETWELGKWDDTDLVVGDKKINIKSTKHYGNLLLLETKDWDNQGQYLPNLESGASNYDFFILCRLSPDGEGLMRSLKLMYSNSLPMSVEEFKTRLMEEKWAFDIPGYIAHADLVEAIRKPLILPQGSMLQGRTKMDAENFYIQSGDMRDVNDLVLNVLAKRELDM